MHVLGSNGIALPFLDFWDETMKPRIWHVYTGVSSRCYLYHAWGLDSTIIKNFLLKPNCLKQFQMAIYSSIRMFANIFHRNIHRMCARQNRSGSKQIFSRCILWMCIVYTIYVWCDVVIAYGIRYILNKHAMFFFLYVFYNEILCMLPYGHNIPIFNIYT